MNVLLEQHKDVEFDARKNVIPEQTAIKESELIFQNLYKKRTPIPHNIQVHLAHLQGIISVT